jgi:hypothetical protein
MIPQGFQAGLITYAKASPANEAEIRAEFTALFTAVKSGRGKQRASFSSDGTSATWTVQASNEELFGVYAQVVRALDGTSAKATVARYS